MSTPHNRANVGDIAKSILLPGDPRRAKYIAEKFFDSPVLFNDVRGMLGYTGKYKGKPVSVMGTGMGIPSISIYASELVDVYGCKNLIRVGTCGGFLPEIGLKDIILGSGCCTDNGYNRKVFSGDFAPIPSFELLNTAYEKAEELGIKTHIGLLKSSDLFYFEDVAGGADKWLKYGVIGAEMEGAALYTIAQKARVRALVIASVSDSMFIKEDLTAEERERSLDNMIKIALETAIDFD